MESEISAHEAREKLIQGNAKWLADGQTADVSKESVSKLLRGQHPYAVIVTCSDSRVIPEAFFHAGTGDLFVIRTAGNTIGGETMGSIEYAVEHLGSRLVVILGHTGCGAVASALAHAQGTYVSYILDKITEAIGSETDPDRACRLNVHHSAQQVREALGIDPGSDAAEALSAETADDVCVAEAVYHLEDGRVEFL